jgi:hypothetical protein
MIYMICITPQDADVPGIRWLGMSLKNRGCCSRRKFWLMQHPLVNFVRLFFSYASDLAYLFFMFMLAVKRT